MLKDLLTDIGLNENEAMIYIELLRLGPLPASVIAKRLSYKRTTLYGYLSAIISKGLIEAYISKGIKYFKANDPNSLVSFVDERYRTYEYYRDRVVSALPVFRTLVNTGNVVGTKLVFAEDYDAVNHMLAFEGKKVNILRAFLPNKVLVSALFKKFCLESDLYFCELPMLNYRLLVVDNFENRQFFSAMKMFKHDNKKLRFVSEELSSNFNDSFFNIYPDKVVFADFRKGFENAFKFESFAYSDIFKKMFDFIWNNSSL